MKLTRRHIDAGIRGLSECRAILDGAKPAPVVNHDDKLELEPRRRRDVDN